MNIKFNRNLKLKRSPDPDFPQFTRRIGILGEGAKAKIEIYLSLLLPRSLRSQTQ